MQIESNLRKIRKELDEAAQKLGKEKGSVKLIAVSKTFPVSVMKEAFDAGQLDFAESYPQEMRDKLPDFEAAGFAPNLHFIGNLQRNKAKYVVGNSVLVQSVSSVKLGKAINKIAAKLGIVQDCLLQFNISGEDAKGGFEAGQLDATLEAFGALPHTRIMGVMGMAGLDSDEDDVRREFDSLREISDKLRLSLPEATEISMGMSEDYLLAVEHGSTMVRIGSALFGERDYGN